MSAASKPAARVEVRPRVSGQIVGSPLHRRRDRPQGPAALHRSIRGPTPPRSPKRAPVSRRRAAELGAGRDRTSAAPAGCSPRRPCRRANVDQLAAQVQIGPCGARRGSGARRAALARRRVHAQVRAPISGRISDRRIDAGNLVSAGDGGGTLLTTINALDPIYFTFDVPESLVPQGLRANASAGAPRRGRRDPAPGRGDYSWRGRLDFTDNGISQNSGTIRARAVVPNPDLFPDARHVRQHAAGRRRNDAWRCSSPTPRSAPIRHARSCWSSARTTRSRPSRSRPGPLVGDLRVIRSGLTAADRVVVQGVQFAMPGAKVQPAGHPDPARPKRHAAKARAAILAQARHRQPWPLANRANTRCASATSSSGARSSPA